MPYVQRRDGKINGLFRWPVCGVAEKDQEFLADDNPEVVAYKTPPSEAEKAEATLTKDPVFRRLIAVLADKFGTTARELMDEIIAKV
jgi:hypothetical protein